MAHGVILGQTPTLDTSTLVTQEQLNNTLNGYATTTQLNNYLLRSGGTLTGQINMSSNKITNLADGTAATDAATVGQVNESIQAQMGTTGLVYPSAVSPDDQFTFNGLMVRVNTTVSNDMDIDANATMNFTALWNWWTNSETLQTGSAIYFAGGNTEIPIRYNANNSKWQVVGSGTNYPRQGMLMLFTGAYL